MPTRRDTLNTRQAEFVRRYLVTLNATQAAKDAGYSARSAQAQGCQLLKHPKVAAAIAAARAERAEATALSAVWVIEELRQTYQRATEAGQFTAAKGCLELLGKHLGMFEERVRHLGLSDAERVARIEELFARASAGTVQ